MPGINEVNVTGNVSSFVLKDHVFKEVQFYRFLISIPRKSGVEDVIPVVISGKLLEERGIEIEKGDTINIIGEYRSYYENGVNRLKLYIHAKDVQKIVSKENVDYKNEINLKGYVRNKGELRTSPKGRKIVDVSISVKMYNRKSAYIPCIIWCWDKNGAKDINVGDEIYITGRIQSREYQKVLDNGDVETRTAYEVSVSKFEVLN